METIISKEIAPKNIANSAENYHPSLRTTLASTYKKLAIAAGILLVSPMTPTEAAAGENITFEPISHVSMTFEYHTDETMEILIDSNGEKKLHGFIKTRLKETNQLPKDETEAYAYIDAFLSGCYKLNPEVDFDNFEAINGTTLLFPRNMRVFRWEDVSLWKETIKLTTIIIPAGKGFLWIKTNYNVDEAKVRELNPQLEGRGLHKDEKVKIPKQNQ